MLFDDIQAHELSVSISDDDLCADCFELLYCPGDLSLCRDALRKGEWPYLLNRDGYAICCRQFVRIEPGQLANWVPLPPMRRGQ